MKKSVLGLVFVVLVNGLILAFLVNSPTVVKRWIYQIKFGYEVKKMTAPKSVTSGYDRNQILSLYNLNDNPKVILGQCEGKILSPQCNFQILASIKSVDLLNNRMEVLVDSENVPIDIGIGTLVESVAGCPDLDLRCVEGKETVALNKEKIKSGDLARLKITGYKLDKLKAAAVLILKNEKE